jgi:protein phosphatase
MGGHSAGEVASGIIVDKIAELTKADSFSELAVKGVEDRCDWIMKAVWDANKAVYDKAQEIGSDMGSTCVMAMAAGNHICIGHVGDSRVYLIDSHEIKQVTTDHSLVERLVETGQITRKEARRHPQRNVIYRTVGDSAKVDVDTPSLSMKRGDRLLLCSDGLNGMIEDEDIHQIVMNESSSPQEACEKLIEAAKNAGGDDNITAVLLEIA